MRGWAGRKGGGSAMGLMMTVLWGSLCDKVISRASFRPGFFVNFFGKKENGHKVILNLMLIHRILVKLAG